MKKRMALVLGVLALAIMAPGVAQAEMQEPHFQGTAGPLELFDEDAAFNMELVAQAGCAHVYSMGTMPIETKSIDLWHGFEEECELFGYDATVKWNGCGLRLTVENVGPPYQGAAGIWCFKAGESIELKDDYGACSVKIHPSEGVPGSVDYENVGSGAEGSFIADVHMSKMNYTITANSLWCPVAGWAGTWSNGTLSTVLGLDSRPLENGVSLQGEEV